LKDLLARVDLYKVGHHGSKNATPQSLWKLFKRRSKKDGKKRLISVLSTMRGKYPDVPKTSLVDALKAETKWFSTEQLDKKSVIAKEFSFDV
jgi:beta-lactamase superfamily II metal-dependent hydrolase